MSKQSQTKFQKVLSTVFGIPFIIMALPFMIGFFLLYLIVTGVAQAILFGMLRMKKTNIVVYRGKDAELARLVDEYILPKLPKDILVLSREEKGIKILRFFLAWSYHVNEPAIFLTSGRFKRNFIQLGNALIKFKKGNPRRLKNILFKLKMSGIVDSAVGSDNSEEISIDEFRNEIFEELLTMAKTQEDAQPKESYSIPLEDYESDFRSFKNPTLDSAWCFIDAWIDEADHGYQGFYGDMKKEDWPEFARSIAESIKTQSPIRADIYAKFNLKRFKSELPWYRNSTNYFLIIMMFLSVLFFYRCVTQPSPSVCHQVSMKDC
jgi:hypothetical protein